MLGYSSLHDVVSQSTYWSASYAEPPLFSENVPTSRLKIQIDTGQEFHKGHRLEGTQTTNYLFFFKISDDAVPSQISRNGSLLPNKQECFLTITWSDLRKYNYIRSRYICHRAVCKTNDSTDAWLGVYAGQYFFISRNLFVDWISSYKALHCDFNECAELPWWNPTFLNSYLF